MRLQKLMEAQTRGFNAATVGRRLPVLLEKRGRQPGQLIGRSPYLQAVWTEAPEARLGEIVDIDITHVGPNSLTGLSSSSVPRRGSEWGDASADTPHPDASPHPGRLSKAEGLFA